MKLLARLAPFVPFIPMLALAQNGVELTFLETSIGTIQTFINGVLIPFIFALALLVFVWGVFQYFVFGGGDEEKRETGKKFMIYGLIGFVVMVAVWGIVEVLVNLLGVDEGVEITPPTFGN